MRNEWRYLRNMDFVLLLTTLALMVFGLVVLASATGEHAVSLLQWSRWTKLSGYSFFQRQLLWAAGGMVCMAAAMMVDYQALARWLRPIYAVNLLLLLLVLVVGTRSELGAQRWISLGPFALQPSELAKPAMVIVLAVLFTRSEEGVRQWRDLLVPALYLLPVIALIIIQPDLGTSMVLVGTFFGMLLVSGFPMGRYLTLLGSTLAAGVGAILLRIYLGKPEWIKPYQITRLTIFLDPYADRFGFGYQIIQSQFAIGSGRLLGKGLFGSAQSQLQYLPEHHSDFIFAILGEELGFVGASALLFLFLILIWRGARVATLAKDDFGSLMAAGLITFLGLHVIVNVGMVLGVMPVTGIPLPFISYGGSAMLVNCTAIGLLLNVHMRRHKIQFG
ncbi:MAG TPA: rod shape-determining protein RodA [Sphingobacteriaceae bacterium]|nr:rod shape-determining protein RodA [Sphingobacteriaceae bacterium]